MISMSGAEFHWCINVLCMKVIYDLSHDMNQPWACLLFSWNNTKPSWTQLTKT